MSQLSALATRPDTWHVFLPDGLSYGLSEPISPNKLFLLEVTLLVAFYHSNGKELTQAHSKVRYTTCSQCLLGKHVFKRLNSELGIILLYIAKHSFLINTYSNGILEAKLFLISIFMVVEIRRLQKPIENVSKISKEAGTCIALFLAKDQNIEKSFIFLL